MMPLDAGPSGDVTARFASPGVHVDDEGGGAGGGGGGMRRGGPRLLLAGALHGRQCQPPHVLQPVAHDDSQRARRGHGRRGADGEAQCCCSAEWLIGGAAGGVVRGQGGVGGGGERESAHS